MNKIKDLPKNERPREKLLDIGVQNLSDCELLAVIIGIKVLDHIISMPLTCV